MSKEPKNCAGTCLTAATPLPDEIAALLGSTPQATAAELAGLEKAAAALREAPDFVADVAKGLIVEDILRAMEAANLNRNTLAAKIGKSRQYVGKILDEHRRANFTIDTLAELATALGVSLQVRMLPENEMLTGSGSVMSHTEIAVIETYPRKRPLRAFARKSAGYRSYQTNRITAPSYERTSIAS